MDRDQPPTGDYVPEMTEEIRAKWKGALVCSEKACQPKRLMDNITR